MINERAAKLLRAETDEILRAWKKVPRKTPKRGWIYTVREALGMSTAQLAARLKISQSAVVGLEQSEAGETMQLKTLRRVARALHCEVVYALVPKSGTLENTLEQRRLILAMFALDPALKGADLTAAEKRDLMRAYGAKIKRRSLWG